MFMYIDLNLLNEVTTITLSKHGQLPKQSIWTPSPHPIPPPQYCGNLLTVEKKNASINVIRPWLSPEDS